MITEEEHQTKSPAEEEGSIAAGPAPAAPPADAELPATKKAGPFRQLYRNLKGGVRIALSLPVTPDSFCATAQSLAVICILDFLLNLGVSFLLVGRQGGISYSAVPSFFFHLPLFLLFGLLAGRLLSRPSLLGAIPVALVGLSIPLELTHAAVEGIAQLPQFPWLEDYLNAPHYYRFFWWWCATGLLFLVRIKGASIARRLAVLLLFLLLVVLPLWNFPRADLWASNSEGAESGELHLTDEVLSAQARLLDGELAALAPGRAGITDLYFVGFAGDATQDVFLKELTATERLFSTRFGTFGRSVLLVNNPKTATTLPFATDGNLQRTLIRVGRVMNRDQDVLFLYLTSHGSKEHELAVNNDPLELEQLTPENLKGMLEESGIRWKVIVVSACYSGGFIDPLKDDDTLVITAADATHESFGCGFGENFTWFGDAFVNQALRQTASFTDAFDKARETIRKWEEEQGETPSNPQIWMGRKIAPKLAELQRRLEEKGR